MYWISNLNPNPNSLCNLNMSFDQTRISKEIQVPEPVIRSLKCHNPKEKENICNTLTKHKTHMQLNIGRRNRV